MNIITEGCPVSHRTAFLLQLYARAIERLHAEKFQNAYIVRRLYDRAS